MAEWVVRETADGITAETLIDAAKSCYSYENHAAHGIEELSTDYIGTVYAKGQPSRLYLIYRDKGGTFWYKTLIETERGAVDPHEAIFGSREKHVDRRRRTGK